MARWIACCLASLGLITSGSARAIDGVIEINQASALAGGVNGSLATDPPGFPVSITVPGSYRLTSNLTTNPQAGRVVIVDTTNVTLDLNGFSLVGAASCGAAGGNCTPTGQAGFEGVYANSGAHDLTIRNGVIRGMIGAGVELQGLAARLLDVRVLGNANGGAIMAPYCTASRVTAVGNGADGIRIDQGCTVSGSTSNGNHDDGIEVVGTVGGGSVVRESVVSGNGIRGIFVCGGASLKDNDVSRNATGIEIGNTFGSPCSGALGELTGNRVVGNTSGVAISNGSSARLVGNTIIGNLNFGLSADTGFLGARAFVAYGNNVIRGSGTTDVSFGGGPFGTAEAIELAPNVCGTDTICP